VIKNIEKAQPEVNIGLVGHVDHGKTSLLLALSGQWADTHSEEIKRGITIRLGYANATFYKDNNIFTTKKTKTSKPIRKVSFVDAPGHESLMATMLSGSAIMDGALLLIAANEKCPQPQTKEHLMALEILGVKNIIIIQNKIDLVSLEEAKENFKQIKEFTKGTIAENSPIIPISAQHNVNIDSLIEAIEKYIPTPKRDDKTDPLFFIARSFDINKPGTEIKELIGGVLGGSLKQGKLKINQEVEIKRGIKEEKQGKVTYKPLRTKIIELKSGKISIKEVHPGGSIGILTDLDPSIIKSDSLSGNILGFPNKLPETLSELTLKPHLLKRVVGSKEELQVDQIKKGETLLLNVNASATVGIVNELKKDQFHINLKIPVCPLKDSRITISRVLGGRFRLIGWAELV